MCSRIEAPKARNMIARGKRESASPLEQIIKNLYEL